MTWSALSRRSVRHDLYGVPLDSVGFRGSSGAPWHVRRRVSVGIDADRVVASRFVQRKKSKPIYIIYVCDTRCPFQYRTQIPGAIRIILQTTHTPGTTIFRAGSFQNVTAGEHTAKMAAL